MRPIPLLAVVLAATILPQTAAAQGEAPFMAQGEIVYQGSAAYDATRVRGPKVNMALTKDGKWGGTLEGKDVLLTVKPDRISGAGVNLQVSQDATALSVEGMISGIRIRVKATAKEITARVGNRQVELARHPDGYWHLAGGPKAVGAIKLKGTADRVPEVPMPQWIFALIGAM